MKEARITAAELGRQLVIRVEDHPDFVKSKILFYCQPLGSAEQYLGYSNPDAELDFQPLKDSTVNAKISGTGEESTIVSFDGGQLTLVSEEFNTAIAELFD